MCRACSMHDSEGECICSLVEEPEETTRRHRYRWEDTIVMDHREIGFGGIWTGYLGFLARQRPVAGSCEHGNEPLGSIKYWIFMNG